MGDFRPLETKCWEKFLAFKGYKHVRTAASHDQWVKPGYRTIPVWGSKKQIPPMHLKTSCRTIGCTMKEMYEWAMNNC